MRLPTSSANNRFLAAAQGAAKLVPSPVLSDQAAEGLNASRHSPYQSEGEVEPVSRVPVMEKSPPVPRFVANVATAAPSATR